MNSGIISFYCGECFEFQTLPIFLIIKNNNIIVCKSCNYANQINSSYILIKDSDLLEAIEH